MYLFHLRLHLNVNLFKLPALLLLVFIFRLFFSLGTCDQ